MRYTRWLLPILLLAECAMRTSPAIAGEVRIPIGPFSGGCAVTANVKSLKEMHEEGIVRQRLDFSCGAAATATILTSYLGEPCTEQEIINYIVAHNNARELIIRQGFSLLDLKKYAESKGIQGVGYRLTFELLTKDLSLK